MKFSTALMGAALAATGLAQDVACRVNGVQYAVVDLDTGNCPFPIPDDLPVDFSFVSDEDYYVDTYYVLEDGTKYFNDIENAGRYIDVPARYLYGGSSLPMFHIHLEETPAVNSTAAMRKRFNMQPTVKRDALSDFIAYIKSLTGTALTSTAEVSVSDPDVESSSASSSSSSETTGSTTIITVSSTGVPATMGLTTTTIEGVETSYTTWCPISVVTETAESTTIITITSCEDHKCHEKTASATWGKATLTVEGEVTVWTTWCPIEEETEAAAPTHKGGVVTTTKGGVVDTTTEGGVVVTTTKGGVVTTVAAESTGKASTKTAFVTSTIAPGSTASVTTSFAGSAARVGGSLLALVVLPLYFL